MTITPTFDAGIANIHAPVFVRVSHRAKYARLNVSRSGLEVVVPRRFGLRRMAKFIDEKREWIDTALTQARQQFGGFVAVPVIPTSLTLRALDECLSIRCVAASTGRFKRYLQDDVLYIDCPKNDRHAIFAVLRDYLKQRARPFFSQQLRRLSETTGLVYTRLSVRGQRTRWGSYSRQGAVSLNYKLLFLPPHLVEHVLLHELCHSRYMDHSARFWGLLASFDPAMGAHRKALRKVDHLIPDWMDYLNRAKSEPKS